MSSRPSSSIPCGSLKIDSRRPTTTATPTATSSRSRAPSASATSSPNLYAFHWHNKWTTPIRPGTLAGRLYDEIDAKFRAAHE